MIRLPKGKYHPVRLIYKNILRYSLKCKSDEQTDIPIDILIPVATKDVYALPFVVDCARKNILNPIENIYIVGADDNLIQDFCREHHCVFLNEDQVLPIQKSDITYKDSQWPRAGWLLQQLIKLNADEISGNEYVLVLDADTCFTAKQSFVLNNGDFILNFSDEYHFPYDIYKRLLGKRKRYFLSFVCHHMIFNNKILRNLKSDLQLNTGKSWIQAILDNVDLSESSCFSEYEMYGNYLYDNYYGRVHLEYWKNVKLNYKKIDTKRLNKYNGRVKSVSFHKYSK